MARRLRLVGPPVGPPRADVAALIERHANMVVDWLILLVDAHNDPSATDPELTAFCETALSVLEARIASLRADLRSSAR